MAKIKREQLVAAAKDLNKVLGLEPPINTNTTKEKELVTALSEVVDMIDETDEIKDSTREVLVQLGFIQPDVEDDDEDVEDVEDDEDVEDVEDVQPTSPTLEELKDLITDCNSTKELKELMKHELLTEFTPSAKVKNVIDLRTAMLDFLEKDKIIEEFENVDDVENVKDVKEVTEKVGNVKKPAKKEVVEKTEKTEKVKKETSKLTLLEAFHTVLNRKKQLTLDEFSDELMKIRPATNIGHGKNFISASLQLLIKFDVVSLDGRNYKLND